VDAVHAQKQLDEHDEARRQIGFADRILLSKTDLVDDNAKVEDLTKRLRQMNPRAQQRKVHMGKADIKELLDIRGFNLTPRSRSTPSSSPATTTSTTTR
jgi:G3E family GTPase